VCFRSFTAEISHCFSSLKITTQNFSSLKQADLSFDCRCCMVNITLFEKCSCATCTSGLAQAGAVILLFSKILYLTACKPIKNAIFAASNIFKRIESCKTEVNPAFGTNIPAKAERTGKKVEFLRIFVRYKQWRDSAVQIDKRKIKKKVHK